MANFDYYRLSLKLLTDQLGTCTEASIYDEHVIKKSQKLIKQANKLSGKVAKMYEKYKGSDEIGTFKEYEEMRGIIARYQELIGRKDELPHEIEPLLSYAKELQDELDEIVQLKDQQRATCFMRTPEGRPMLSSHMIIGNLKENLRIITNNSTLAKADRPIAYKTQVGEMLALDVKPVEPFMFPDLDIKRKPDGLPELCERPINFERMGKRETAIALSEVLPAGAEYSVTLRVRKDSPFNDNDAKLLRNTLDLGKNNGMGQWRGSGTKGTYCYKLERVEEPKAIIPDGWN